MKQKRAVHISVFGSRITSVVSVTLVLILLGLTALIATSAKEATDAVRRNLGFTIKMEQGVQPGDINAIKKMLSGAIYADSYVYASADEILAQESEIIGEDILLLVDENPYGAEFDVHMASKYASSDSIEKIADSLAGLPGVEDIITDTSVINTVNDNIRRLTWIMLAVAAALLVISFVLINNTVSLAVYSRRFIIHTMRLVGATGSFIRRPFLMAGIVTGLISAVCASIILAAAQAYAMKIDPAIAATLNWRSGCIIYICLAIVGVALCLIASAFATNRYLRTTIDEYYMN